AAMAMPALSTSPSSRPPTAAAAASIPPGSVTSRISSVVPAGALPCSRTPANTCQPPRASRSAQAWPMPDEAPVTRTERSGKDRFGDLGALLGREPAVALDPLGPLVVAVQRVLPGEADAAVCLDRVLADLHGHLRRVGLGRRGSDRRLLVSFGHGPGGPVRERPGELGQLVRVGEPVRDSLVDADRLAELLARLRVLDPELEDALRHADCLHRQCGERPRPDAVERSRVADRLA